MVFLLSYVVQGHEEQTKILYIQLYYFIKQNKFSINTVIDILES